MQDFALTALRWATAMLKQFPLMSVVALAMLICVIVIITYMALHIVTGIPISTSEIRRTVFSNYANFPVDKPEWDAQVLGYGEVTITNISEKEKVALDLTLHITGDDGTNIRAQADLRGPFGMIYGKDDEGSKKFANLSFGEAKKFFKNPIELEPRQVERRLLEFVFAYMDIELRNNFVQIVTKDQNYKFDLEIADLISGHKVVIRLPGQYRGEH